MKTGLTKREPAFALQEADEFVEIFTYNTDFKKRLAAFAEKYPTECR